MAELDGQIGLVTGGGRGIGADVARELASAGMRVAVSARTRSQVEAVAAELGGLAIEADVSKREDVERMVEQTERELGPIDLLVANAGVGFNEGLAWEMEPADWWRTQEVNVLGVYLCCRAVIPGMLERGRGRIVITASGAAYLPGSSETAYSASKAAVARFGETLANQLDGRIPVFPISPGLVRTEMTSRFPETTCRGRRRSARRRSCGRSRQDASTGSAGATSTPSTTRRTSWSSGSSRSSATI